MRIKKEIAKIEQIGLCYFMAVVMNLTIRRKTVLRKYFRIDDIQKRCFVP